MAKFIESISYVEIGYFAGIESDEDFGGYANVVDLTSFGGMKTIEEHRQKLNIICDEVIMDYKTNLVINPILSSERYLDSCEQFLNLLNNDINMYIELNQDFILGPSSDKIVHFYLRCTGGEHGTLLAWASQMSSGERMISLISQAHEYIKNIGIIARKILDSLYVARENLSDFVKQDQMIEKLHKPLTDTYMDMYTPIITPDLKERWIDYIRKSQIEEFFKDIKKEYSFVGNSKWNMTILMIESTYNRYRIDKIQNTIRSDEYDYQMSRLTWSILQLLEII